MMLRTFLIFLVLLASVMLGVQLQHDPGYVLIALNHWTVETTVWVGFIGLIVLFILFHSLLLWIHWMLRLPTAWSRWLAKRRVQTAQTKTRQGLIEFSEGYWEQAKNHLIKALPSADTPLINYLTAARAAQELGESKLRDEYLRRAQQSMPEAKIAVGLTQAQLQLANRQWEQALATLRHLHDLAPHHPYVLKLLMHLYEEIKDWPQLLALLPDLKRNQVITGQDYERLQQHIYFQTMREFIKQRQTDALVSLMNNLPKSLRYDVDIVAEYSRYLRNHQDSAQAEQLLRQCLQKTFHEEWIDIYGEITSDETQLPFAESLLKKQPHSANLYLCLARLCYAQSLWGKAKTYLDKSLELNPTPAAYIEQGKLLEQLGDQTGACAAYRQGLLLT